MDGRKIMAAALACVAAAAALFAQSAAAGMPGDMMAPNLTGQMAKMQYMLGVWACSVKLPSMTGGAATTDTGSISFEASPGNSVATATHARDYSAYGYFGYNAKASAWWSTGIDNSGNAWSETSKDAKDYTGQTDMGGGMTPIRDTFSKFSAT